MKNIKTILAVTMLAICLGLSGCDALDRTRCQENVSNAFPDSEVVQTPNGYRFIVRDKNGNIWYVETMNMFDANVSGKVLVFRAGK